MAGRSQDALGLKYRGGGDAELFLKWRERGLAALKESKQVRRRGKHGGRGCVSRGEDRMEQDVGGGKDHWGVFREGCYPDMFELFQIICR